MKLPPVEYKKLGRQYAHGVATIPDGEKKGEKNLIELDERLRGFNKTKYLLHEGLHIYFPNTSEQEIISLSFFLARLLNREGCIK